MGRRKTIQTGRPDDLRQARVHGSETVNPDSVSHRNGSRNQGMASLSINPAPCEQMASGSQNRTSVRWSKTDCDILLAVEPHRRPDGGIDHDQLLTRWDTLKRDGLVSNIERSANALIAKYRELKTRGTVSSNGAPAAVAIPLGEEDQVLADPVDPTTQGVEEENPAVDEGDRIGGDPDTQSEADEVVLANTDLFERNSSWDRESFDTEFNKNYRLARYVKNRVAIRPIRNRRIPEEWLQLANDAVSNCIRDNVNSLECLNAAVYSAAKTIVDKLFTESSIANRVWYGKNAQKRRVLCQNIGRLRSIMDQIKSALSLTSHQRQNLNTLRRLYGKRYKVRTLPQMEVLYHDLTSHLSKCQSLLKVRSEEASRKRARWAPLSSVLREDTEATNTPVESVRNYWEKIIGTPRVFKMNPMLLGWERTVIQERTQEDANMARRETDLDLWRQVCKKARPFKAYGPDFIHSFWWKVLPSANESLFQILLNLKAEPTRVLPCWVARGRAISLYKGKGDRNDPGNYRTIACLNTCYKFITGMITRWLDYEVRKVPTALPTNQMALRKGVWATTHAHILDRTIVNDAVGHNRQLSIAWIDFAKAFDSVPHPYIRWVLETIGVSESIRNLLVGLMSLWELTFTGFVRGKMKVSTPLKVQNGVLQGDTLSPLLFCLSVAPVSHYLNTNLQKYTTSTGRNGRTSLSINHIYYVDDLVIYTPHSVDLDRAVADIEFYAKDFGLLLNATKSAKYHIGPQERGGTQRVKLNSLPTIRGNETYRYLGIEKSQSVDHATMWSSVKEDILKKADKIFSSQLTLRQKVSAFNSVAIPKAKYLFGNEIIGAGKFKSVLEQADVLDRKIRALLVARKVRHRGSSKLRLHVNPEQGGFGLKKISVAVHEAVVYTFCYTALRPELKTSWTLMETLDRRTKRSLLSDFRVTSEALGLEVVRDPNNLTLRIGERVYSDPTVAARAITADLMAKWHETWLQGFLELRTASSVYRNQGLDLTKSFFWLFKGVVSSEVANNAIAAQEGQLLLKGHPMYRVNRTCRLYCSAGDETAEHVLTVCPHWRTTLMVKRHNSVARNIYYTLCVMYGFKTVQYNQTIEGYRKCGSIDLYWDHPLITVKKVLHHRPDIVVIDNEQRTVTIVEVSVSWHTRIPLQEKRKYSKYAVNSTLPESHELNSDGTFPVGDNLATEIGRDLGYVVTVLPVVLGATGEVSKNTFGYLRKLNLTGSQCDNLIERMSRSSVIGSAVILKAHCSIPQNRLVQ